MGQKKMYMAEKSCALTLLQKGDSVIAVVKDIEISREAIYQLKRLDTLLPSGIITKRKSGSGAPKKTSPKMDKLLKYEETSYPSSTAVESKNKHHELLHNVSTTSIRHRLQKVLGLPCCHAVKNPMLTTAMKYRHWTAAEWRKVIFSDESTFALVRELSKIVRHPSSASQYNQKIYDKNHKTPWQCNGVGNFQWKSGPGWFVLPSNKCNNEREHLYEYFERAPFHILEDSSM